VAALVESCLIAADIAGDRQRRHLAAALEAGDDPLITP
jgi:hypothetical protein